MAVRYSGILDGIMAAEAANRDDEEREFRSEQYAANEERQDKLWSMQEKKFGFTKDQALKEEQIRRSESTLKILGETGYDAALTTTSDFKANVLWLGNALGDAEGADNLIAGLSRNPETLAKTTNAIRDIQKSRNVRLSPEELIEGIEVISENADDPDFISKLSQYKDLRRTVLMGSLDGLNEDQYSDAILKLADLGQYTPPNVAVDIDPALYGDYDPAILKRQQVLFKEGVLSLANQDLTSDNLNGAEKAQLNNQIKAFGDNPIPLQNKYGYLVTQKLKGNPSNAYLFEQKIDPSVSQYTIPQRAIEILTGVSDEQKQEAIKDFNKEYGFGAAEFILNAQNN